MSYKDTLNLPQTDFPMRAGLPTQEPKWIQRWHEEQVYTTLRQQRADAPKYILHCGPPYANGQLHMGHALSKTLKDIVVRSRTMMGFNAPFIPGWDCHGLPIEWKVVKGLADEGLSEKDLSKSDIQKRCRKEAQKWVDIQKEEWRRLGVLADFDNAYLTMNFKNEANIVRAMAKVVEGGYLYKGLKPVHWSTVEQTALAEAEIEYADKKSTAVYVAFDFADAANESVVIWTTTPWSLPGNKAVAFAEDTDYVAIQVNEVEENAICSTGKVYHIAAALLEDFTAQLGIKSFTKVKETTAEDYRSRFVKHPFYALEVPLVSGFHVTTDAGTGFVHIAPSHGQEDFQIGVENNLELECPVGGDGCYLNKVAALPTTETELKGESIWDAQYAVIKELRENGQLLKKYNMTHSYPCSWRSKAPLMFRTTNQWYISMDKHNLKQKALAEIERIGKEGGWVPAYGENRIKGMVEGRPDWCISRQRAWGVPVTIFVHKESGEYLTDPEVFEHVASLIEQKGIEVWFDSSVEELLPESYQEKASEYTKEEDILDVWIDSGMSHFHVLKQGSDLGLELPADLYLEGSDQHRGWFQSSLMTSMMINDKAPYKAVLTHGFVVDGEGKKMSKSIGNVIQPQELAEKYGVDIVRLWVANADYSEDMRLSDEIVKRTTDVYRRLRNTFRYLLSNMYDFDITKDAVAYDDMPEIEKWVLARLHQVVQISEEGYKSYKFQRALQEMMNFCSTDLSSFYFDVRKDCLYADAPNSTKRRASQTVQYHLLQALVTYLSPIIPFTTDEVWRSFKGEDTTSVHLGEFYKVDNVWQNTALIEKWEQVRQMRTVVTKEVEELRTAKEVGSGLEAQATLYAPQEKLDLLATIDMADVCVISELKLEVATETSAKATIAAGEKCPRCWKFASDIGSHASHTDVCGRCAEALDETKAEEVA